MQTYTENMQLKYILLRPSEFEILQDFRLSNPTIGESRLVKNTPAKYSHSTEVHLSSSDISLRKGA
jgi:hypothetical protein